MVIIFRRGVSTSVRPENKIRATAGTMHKNNETLLAGAWWVILNSPDLFVTYVSYLSSQFFVRCNEDYDFDFLFPNHPPEGGEGVGLRGALEGHVRVGFLEAVNVIGIQSVAMFLTR